MEDWGVVERVRYLCQRASRIWASKGKGRWEGSSGLSWEWGRPKGIMGLSYMALNGLIFKIFFFFFGKVWNFKRAKGRSLVQS